MTTTTIHPFWHVDGEIADACPRAPHHLWREFIASDLLTYPIDPNEKVVFCTACFVLRCGQPDHRVPNCDLQMPHHPPHRDAQGRRIDPWPTTTEPPPKMPMKGRG